MVVGGIGFLVLLITHVSFAQTPDTKTIEAELRQSYEQKLLSLRNPKFGKTLIFDPAGTLISQATAGPWSTCGLLRVRRVKVSRQEVEIEGKRVILALRSDEKDQPAAPKRVQVIPVLTGDDIRIHIHIAAADRDEIIKTLARIFQGGRLLDRVSAYWKPRTNDSATPSDTVFGELEGGRPVYRVKAGVVEPPRAIYSPEPEFTEAARRSRTQGTAQLSVIINEAGFPEVLEIVGALGEGLDIQALSTVAKWRFHPATREDKPVAVVVIVEVTFHLG